MGQLLGQNKFLENALKYGFSLWGLPKTGQTTSYRTGDDGDLKKGYPKTGVRFTDNEDGTITDNATGLMWVKEPGACGGNFGSAGNPSTMIWDNAIDECNALNYAGHSNWRLPNAWELTSIRRFLHHSPTWDPVFFPTPGSTYYWTSTIYYDDADFRWGLRTSDGFQGGRAKTATDYVRPVRLGVPKD